MLGSRQMVNLRSRLGRIGRGQPLGLALLLMLGSCRLQRPPVEFVPGDRLQTAPTPVAGESERPWRQLALQSRGGWDRVALPLEAGAVPHQIVAVSTGPRERVLLTVAGQQVFRSTDAGSTWEPWPLALGSLPPDAQIELHPSPTYAQDRTLFVLATAESEPGQTAVYRSGDGGASWQRSLVGPVRRLTLSPTFSFDHTLLAVGAGTASTWLSRDGGASWVEFGTGGRFWFSPRYWLDRVLFAAARSQLFQRLGDADGWISVLSEARVKGLAFSPQHGVDGTILAYGDDLYRSTTSGAQWESGLLELDESDRVEAVAASATQGFAPLWLAVVAHDGPQGVRYQIMRAVDDTQDWRATAGEWGADDVPSMPAFSLAMPSRVYLPTSRGLWLSEDSGFTWNDLTPYTGASGAPPRVRGSVVVLNRAALVEICFLATDTGLWRLVRPIPFWDDD
jgi:hypothetical protein